MRRDDFLDQLSTYLQSLPFSERQSTIDFYAEQIDDRIDDGMSEEEAVASLEHPKDIANNLLSLRDEQSLEFYVPQHEPQKTSNSNIALIVIVLILTCWIWIPLLLGILFVIAGIYATLFALVVSGLVLGVSCVLGGLAALASAATLIPSSLLAAISHLGLALGLIGLSILSFLAAYYISKFTIWMSVELAHTIKHYFEKRKDKKRMQALQLKRVQTNEWGEK